eukprot:32072-Pyramimonas_sp.AAC.1
MMGAGLDSLAAVELRNALNEELGVELPVTALFDYPTMSAFTKHISAVVSSRAARVEPDTNKNRIDPLHPSSRPPASSRRTHHLSLEVLSVARSVMGSEIGQNDPFMDAGLDSLGGVELRNALSKQVGVDLPTTLVFDYPSVAAVASYLASHVAAVD